MNDGHCFKFSLEILSASANWALVASKPIKHNGGEYFRCNEAVRRAPGRTGGDNYLGEYTYGAMNRYQNREICCTISGGVPLSSLNEAKIIQLKNIES